MPILVKSDDVRSGRKAKGRHGPLWWLGSQWVDTILIQFQLFILYETRPFMEKVSRRAIHPGIFAGRALWADSGPPRMNTIVSYDQFKPIRIGEI